jgi:hypothetical protein
MRTVGTILSFLCILISIVLLWMGYVLVFEGNQLIPESESPLPEGSDYWIRLEYWHDVRAYALWILAVLGCVIIPPLGVIRSGRPISSRKATDWFLFGISGVYLVFWSYVVMVRLPEVDWVLIPSIIMFAVCLYGLLVFWRRARCRINEGAQQAVPPNGP